MSRLGGQNRMAYREQLGQTSRPGRTPRRDRVHDYGPYRLDQLGRLNGQADVIRARHP
jgi:hypothetical protein